jgi:TonB family protein
MEPIDSKNSEAIGWHLIARGGDMTARVHSAMQLGILPSGDLSFEAPDAVVQFKLAGEALILDVVADDYELELEAGERIRNIRVGAQTHVCLDFLGHTLDIDNDFAVASPGDALALYVVREGEPRQAFGPLSAPAHEGQIVVGERSSVTPLKAVPVDYLRREHEAATAEKRPLATKRSNVRTVALALAGSVLVVAGLVATALFVASRSVEQANSTDPVAATSSAPSAAVASVDAADPQTATRVPVEVGQLDPGAVGVSQDMFARLSALLQADPLPEKATIDFAVESLRSLMVAYPSDPRIPEALTILNERLVQEARQSYDEGDAFRAGRLIEQATALGLAEASVAETLDYFSTQSPGAAAAQTTSASPIESRLEDSVSVAAEPASIVTDAEAEAMLIETLAQEEALKDVTNEIQQQPTATALSGAPPPVDAQIAAAEDDAGLDSLVESATGLALGALAVEVIVEDIEPGPMAVATDPVLEALGPNLPLAAGAEGVDSRVQLALDGYLQASIVDSESVSANELPDGFAADEFTAGNDDPDLDQPLATGAAPPPSGPSFLPYSDLQPVRQYPLVYPDRALEGAEGSIDVEFTVTETGRVIDVNVSGDAPAVFLRDALRTVRTWRFAPIRQDGEAVPVRTALRVTYRS